MEVPGIALLATGIGTIPGIVLSALGAGAFVVDLACAAITRKCIAKAMKHALVGQVALTKLNSVHRLVSMALNDGKISDEEFKLISDEVDRYQIRSKALKDNEGKKEEWLEKGREEIRVQFAKHLGVTSNTLHK
jgi:hypothetical protein